MSRTFYTDFFQRTPGQAGKWPDRTFKIELYLDAYQSIRGVLVSSVHAPLGGEKVKTNFEIKGFSYEDLYSRILDGLVSAALSEEVELPFD